VSELDRRLSRGPLQVRSVWSGEPVGQLSRRLLHRRRALFVAQVAAACVALAGVSLGVSWYARTTQAPVAATESVTAPVVARQAQAESAQRKFADGSSVELADASSDLGIEHDSARHVVARLHSGSAHFHVVPRAERTFDIHTGEVRVRVLGSEVSLQKLRSGQAEVVAEHGPVEVTWAGGGHARLESGQVGVFPPDRSVAASAPVAVESAAIVAEVAEGARPRVAHRSRRTRGHRHVQETVSAPVQVAAALVEEPAPRTWRDYAQQHDYARAYQELKGHGDVGDDPASLLQAADVFRLAGHAQEALEPLRRLCEHHTHDRRAPVAAFQLGRVLDELKRPADAAVAFQKARTLWPEGPLSEDALAREASAWQAAGQREHARTAAALYIARYPQGRRAQALDKLAR
jgi:transmembrane sensor